MASFMFIMRLNPLLSFTILFFLEFSSPIYSIPIERLDEKVDPTFKFFFVSHKKVAPQGK